MTDEMDAELTLRFSEHVARSLSAVSSSRGCRHSRTRSPAAHPRQSASWPTSITSSSTRRVEQLDLKLFDYRVSNLDPVTGHRPIELSARPARRQDRAAPARRRRHAARLDGQRQPARQRRSTSTASGDANLGILQGFYRDIRSSGAASLRAEVDGPLDEAGVFRAAPRSPTGACATCRCRIRLEAINGTISFDAGGIRVDDVRAKLGERRRRSSAAASRINGFAPGELNLTAVRRADAHPLPGRLPLERSTPTWRSRLDRRRRCCAAR